MTNLACSSWLVHSHTRQVRGGQPFELVVRNGRPQSGSKRRWPEPKSLAFGAFSFSNKTNTSRSKVSRLGGWPECSVLASVCVCGRSGLIGKLHIKSRHHQNSNASRRKFKFRPGRHNLDGEWVGKRAGRLALARFARFAESEFECANFRVAAPSS